MFCKHEWTIIDKTTIPSIFQQLVAANKPTDFCDSRLDYRVHVFLVFSCGKCGKLRMIEYFSWW